jgi:hypothetical protein
MMYETAKQLMDTPVNTHMQMFGVDRETARYWNFQTPISLHLACGNTP